MNIDIRKIDITELDTDAVVNAANPRLEEGGGVCGVIFEKAGSVELSKACREIGGCETGSAAITPGFNLKARYIIHAVGPVWHGGDDHEEELLYGAYKNSLELAKENECRSIAFPVISSGIYGYPKKDAWRIAVKSCRDFLKSNPDYPLSITFAVISEESLKMGKEILTE